MKRQFSKRMFWDLFGDFLEGRKIMISLPNGWLYNWKYTKKAIKYYERRGNLKTKAAAQSPDGIEGETASQ